MLNPVEVIKENKRRLKAINLKRDPKTGDGCDTVERKKLVVSDFPVQALYLPVEMWDKENVVKELDFYGSVESLVVAKGQKFTQEIYYNFLYTFCERRVKYDFEYYAFTRLQISDKETGLPIPFKINRGQRRLLQKLEEFRINRVPIRIILLKARQWGGSTLVQMYFFWIQTELAMGLSSSICAHVQDAARNILNMFDRAVERYPKLPYQAPMSLRPNQGMSNSKVVVGRECTITVGSAIKPDSIRSQSVHLAHFSEVGLYPTTENTTPKDLIESVTSIIPNTPMSAIVYESTAKGIGNFFHTQWLRAKQRKTAFFPIFVEWFLIDIYTKPIEGSVEDFILSFTDYEQYLWTLGATLEAINWYRAKLAEVDNEDSMKQEFPSNDIEAFRLSGATVFNPNALEKMRAGCREPEIVGELYSKGVSISEARVKPYLKSKLFENLYIRKKSSGNFKVWCYPDESKKISNRYVVAVDAGGRSEKSDPSCICVLDRYWMMHGEAPEVVAEWHGHTDLDMLAWNAAQIAKWYNNALLVFESNTFESREASYNTDGDGSEFIFSQIAKYYDNLYSRTPADKIAEGVPPVYGFHTNRTTKPMIVHNYISCLRDMDEGAGYVERENKCIDEALIYEKRKDGSFGNIKGEGNHDDRLMTRMIGLHICYELPTPKDLNDIRLKQFSKKSGAFGSIV